MPLDPCLWLDPTCVCVCERSRERARLTVDRANMSVCACVRACLDSKFVHGFGICVYVRDFYDFRECYVRENYVAPLFLLFW
jgi:hypothetical protein